MKKALEEIKQILAKKGTISEEEFNNLLNRNRLTGEEIEEISDFLIFNEIKIFLKNIYFFFFFFFAH